MVTAPLPSMLAGRDSRRTTWSWCSCSSAASSIVTMRSSHRDERREHVEGRGLAGAGAPGDDDVEAAAHAGVEEVPGGAGERAEPDQVVRGVGVRGELADGQDRAVDRERRDHGVDARAVGQAGVDHRARLVDAAADPGDDLVDRASQVALVGEPGGHRSQPAVLLDEDRVVAVDHDLGDVAVVQELLDRPVADDVVADLLGDPQPVARAQRPLLGGDHVGQDRAQLLVELVGVHVGLVELRTQGLQQLGVDSRADLLETVVLDRGGCGRRGPASDLDRCRRRGGATLATGRGGADGRLGYVEALRRRGGLLGLAHSGEPLGQCGHRVTSEA